MCKDQIIRLYKHKKRKIQWLNFCSNISLYLPKVYKLEKLIWEKTFRCGFPEHDGKLVGRVGEEHTTVNIGRGICVTVNRETWK